MKQSEIDRWMRRQSRRHPQNTMPGVNWALIISVIAISVVVLFLVLKVIHTA